jgi:hypothetical protein
LNPVSFALSTCSTLSTLVSPLIGLSSKPPKPRRELSASAGEPSVQGWPPLPLVRLPGAEVVAAAGEPLGASYSRDPTGVEVVHTCRVDMKLGLRLKADVILLLFVRYF